MTSRQSLFDKGIYKSIIRRFFWGSVAYFILLFLSTGFGVMLTEPSLLKASYEYYDKPMLFTVPFNAFPSLVSCVVPLVVSLLIFRFLHSKKQNIFTHSLPVTKTCNYISSVLGGFTLMAAPILLNAFTLLMLSFFGYGEIILPYQCGIWAVIQLLLIFVIFSVAVLSSVITGNSFASAGVFGIINFLPAIISFIIQATGEIFVYGFTVGNLLDQSYDFIPFFWMFNCAIYPDEIGKRWKMLAFYIILALFIYALSVILYRIRKNEKTGDIAIFACMNPIIKYSVSFLSGLVFMNILVSSSSNTSDMWLVIYSLIAMAIAYFVCEMILKKQLKVFGSYKGCIGMCVASVAIIGTISATGFFGYSTYIPEEQDIKSATLLNYLYYKHPYSSYNEAISLVRETHEELSSQHKFIQRQRNIEDYESSTPLYVWYKLKDGRQISRKYYVNTTYLESLTAKLYEFDDFKNSHNNMLSIDTKEIISLYLIDYTRNLDTEITDAKKIAEFMDIYLDELSQLTYEEMHDLEYEDSNGYIEVEVRNFDEENRAYISWYSEYIHKKCEASYNWIAEYMEQHGE